MKTKNISKIEWEDFIFNISKSSAIAAETTMPLLSQIKLENLNIPCAQLFLSFLENKCAFPVHPSKYAMLSIYISANRRLVNIHASPIASNTNPCTITLCFKANSISFSAR